MERKPRTRGRYYVLVNGAIAAEADTRREANAATVRAMQNSPDERIRVIYGRDMIVETPASVRLR